MKFFLFVSYKPSVHLLKRRAVNNHPQSKMSQLLENIRFFPERLKDTTQRKYNFVKTFDIRHDAKCYKVSQKITGKNAF